MANKPQVTLSPEGNDLLGCMQSWTVCEDEREQDVFIKGGTYYVEVEQLIRYLKAKGFRAQFLKSRPQAFSELLRRLMEDPDSPF